MAKKIKLIASILLGVAVVLATTLPLAFVGRKSAIVSNTADPERTFTYFVGKADGTGPGGVFEGYDQHPGIIYLTDKDFTYKTATKSGGSYIQGEEVTNNTALRFLGATAGQEQNNFITNLNSGEVDIFELDYAPQTVSNMYSSGKLMDLTYWVENYMPNYKKYLEDHEYTELAKTDGKYLQIYSFLENRYEYYYGYQYRRDWVLEYGRVFDTTTGAIGTQTFKEAHPDWGYTTSETGEKLWVDEIIFPSYYGLQYTSDGSAKGVGNFTFNQELYDYMRGEYTNYSVQRDQQLMDEIYTAHEREFETYHGQWPATISDWEWMLDIFQVALDNKGYNDKGYCMSLYQSGFVNTGNLVSSFGGSGVEWHSTANNDGVVFGGDQPAFKTYVETMNKWYNNDWIYKDFTTHTDLFWRTGESTVRQGYVGLYYGMSEQLFDAMDIGVPSTKGICSMGMPYPINDKYGTDSQKYVKPNTFYCLQEELNSIMIAKSAESKDLAALFTMLDATYTEEYAVIKGFGLSKEMVESTQKGVQDFYKDLGYQDGTSVYTPGENGEKGQYYRAEGPGLTNEEEYITSPKRMCGIEGLVVEREMLKEHQYKEYLWNFYEPVKYLNRSFYNQLTPKQYSIYETALASLRSTFSVQIPNFIKGRKSMSEWDGWYNKLKSDNAVDSLTELFDMKYKQIYKITN